MKAGRRIHDAADLARLERERRILELLLHVTPAEKAPTKRPVALMPKPSP